MLYPLCTLSPSVGGGFEHHALIHAVIAGYELFEQIELVYLETRHKRKATRVDAEDGL